MLGIDALWKMFWELLAYGMIPLAGLSVVFYLVTRIWDEITLPRCAACGRPARDTRLGRFYCKRCAQRGDDNLMRRLR